MRFLFFVNKILLIYRAKLMSSCVLKSLKNMAQNEERRSHPLMLPYHPDEMSDEECWLTEQQFAKESNDRESAADDDAVSEKSFGQHGNFLHIYNEKLKEDRGCQLFSGLDRSPSYTDEESVSDSKESTRAQASENAESSLEEKAEKKMGVMGKLGSFLVKVFWDPSVKKDDKKMG